MHIAVLITALAVIVLGLLIGFWLNGGGRSS